MLLRFFEGEPPFVFGFFPARKVLEQAARAQMKRDPVCSFWQQGKVIAKEGDFGFGPGLEGQALAKLLEFRCKSLHTALAMGFPAGDHLFHVAQIVRKRIGVGPVGNPAADGAVQERLGFPDVECGPVGLSPSRLQGGETEFFGALFIWQSDFRKIVEAFLDVLRLGWRSTLRGFGFGPEQRAQFGALAVAEFDLWIEGGEEVEKEWQALPFASTDVHSQPDVEEALTDGVEA